MQGSIFLSSAVLLFAIGCRSQKTIDEKGVIGAVERRAGFYNSLMGGGDGFWAKHGKEAMMGIHDMTESKRAIGNGLFRSGILEFDVPDMTESKRNVEQLAAVDDNSDDDQVAGNAEKRMKVARFGKRPAVLARFGKRAHLARFG